MKIFGTLCGMAFMSAILVFFWYLNWQDRGYEAVKDVSAQIESLENFWNRHSNASGSLDVGYKDVFAAGFPFDMRVRLLHPYIRDIRAEKRFILTTKYLDIVIIDNEAGHYALRYPDDGDAIIETGSVQQRYYLHLSQPIPVEARRSKVGDKMPVTVNEFGLIFPDKALFTADGAAKLQRYPIRFTATESPVWRPMLTDMRKQLNALKKMLQ